MAEWSKERREAASKAIKDRNTAKKSSDANSRMRVPLGAKRDLMNVQNQEEGYHYTISNDVEGRLDRLKQAGYEHVEDAQIGVSNVEGNQASSGVVSKNVGKGITGYVMRQRQDWYDEDQAKKQADIDDLENSMTKSVKSQQSSDGTYGDIKIG